MLGSSQTNVSLGQKIAGAIFVLVLLTAGAVVVARVFPNASNQGYAPEQPIPFSHKLHAGDLKINCQYCHIGVARSPHAVVPSMNICMNCHTQVKTDSPHIQRLTQAYNKGEPIEWVRIHELPDFVRFSHVPHVRAGLACESCHGDIKSMERVYQHAPLTMGWCIQCHRGQTTPSDVLTKIHPDVKDPRGSHVAPQDCSTCHY